MKQRSQKKVDGKCDCAAFGPDECVCGAWDDASRTTEQISRPVNGLVRLGSRTKWGRVTAVAFITGERYYFLTRKAEVAMMPACVVEANAERHAPSGAR